MNIYINNQLYQTEEQQLLDILTEYQVQEPFAIAINNTFIPKESYPNYRIQNNDRIDIIIPIYGG